MRTWVAADSRAVAARDVLLSPLTQPGVFMLLDDRPRGFGGWGFATGGALLVTCLVAARAFAGTVELDGVGACAECAVGMAGPSATGNAFVDFFTGGGNYMPRTHCLTNSAGESDWPWIIGLLALTGSVIVAYLRIFVFWMRSYFREQPSDRVPKLLDLSAIFLLCAVCGYGMSMLMFAWPGYRLLAFFLLLLNYFAWKFCVNLEPFGRIFGAGRLERQLQEAVASRTHELEVQVAERTREANRLAEIARRTANGVVITDPQFRIEWVNEGFSRITGYSLEEIKGKKPGSFLQGAGTDPAEVRKMSGALRKGEAVTVELVNYTKSGRPFIVRVDIEPLRDADGTLTGFMSMESEVTERRRLEAQMQASKEAAEAATRAKSEFLANMSHEIRTPMTAILGYTDLLAEDGDLDEAPPSRREYISTIKRNGEHLLAIINDILDLSKIEAGKMSVERIPTSPSRILDEAEELMRVKAAAKGVWLRVEREGELPACIQSDPLRLKQILLNLIGNAVKFTDEGGVTVRVSMERGGSALPMLRIDVIDTGIGMSPHEAAKLFGAFVQADASTTRRYGGTGLGLRISKCLAGMLGGDITVASEPGVGSTFTLRVATVGSDGVTVAPSGTDEGVERAPRASGPEGLMGIRVLLAEDGPDNQRLISFHLRKAGAIVTTVENGALAVRALTRDGTLEGGLAVPPPFDLVVSDMQMPELDGYQAAAMLRSKGCELPIVALTANAMSGDRERCLSAGCDAYISKPIDKAELIGVCAAMLARRSEGEERARAGSNCRPAV